MDWQLAFNVLMSLFGMLFGWFLNIVWSASKEVRDEISAFRQHANDTYVRRDDHERTSDAIFRKLDRIEDKIDAKADKGAP